MTEELRLEAGGDLWKQWRKRATEAIPGKYSALYFLNAKILGLEPLVPMTYRAHYAMCLFAEHATGIPEIDQARIQLILVPRGLGKSSCITKGRALQLLLQDGDRAVGIANEKQDLANAFLAQIKAEFESNDILRALWPELIPDNFRETTWAADRIVIKRKKENPTSPSVLASGVGATVTGVHMDTWMVDDVISQNAAENAYRGSFSEIEATNRWIGRLQPLLKSPKRDFLTFIGTRWWSGDTYEHIQEFWGHGEPTKEFLWTLKLPDGEEQTLTLVRQGEIAIFRRPAIENGRSIFPERWDLEELEMLSQEDPVFYAGQYLLEPSAGGASRFNPDWLKYYEIDGKQIRYRDQQGTLRYESIRDLITYISVDPAFSKKNSAARTAIPVIGTNGTDFFLLDDYADRIDETTIGHVVCDLWKRFRPNKIFVETLVGQIVIANAIQRIAREQGLGELPLEEIRSHGGQKKLWRIFALEPWFKQGRFHVHRSHQRFLQEYTTFPRSQLRDLLDAISFQKDEWERVERMKDSGSMQSDVVQIERSQIERVRAYGQRMRGRKRA